MQHTLCSSIHEIDADEWNRLWPQDYPFTQHRFLAALEDSGSIDGKFENNSGWQAQYIILRENDQIIAGAPLFLKHHSYGEYVFDWSWANAYHQAGINYYPKYLLAIPFTPATGPRLGAINPKYKQALLDTLLSLIESANVSGLHVLFPDADESPLLNNSFHRRLGYQFHWFNRQYESFDHFLEDFASRKRKNLKKERAKVAAHKLDIRMRSAADISSDEWDTFYQLYHATYLKRSGHAGYLGPRFFHLLAEAMPDQVLLASAHKQNKMIAAAFYLRDNTTLYGRYWGSQLELDGLHFECCYYQGIDYAIHEGLVRFDPGAQGEHKIQRGFTPILTHSFHTLAHPSFNQAIANFVREEQAHVEHYLKDTRGMLPFKEGISQKKSDILLASQQVFS